MVWFSPPSKKGESAEMMGLPREQHNDIKNSFLKCMLTRVLDLYEQEIDGASSGK